MDEMPRFVCMPAPDGSPTLINLAVIKYITAITPTSAHLFFLDGTDYTMSGPQIGSIIKFLMRGALFLDVDTPPDFMNPAKP